MAPVFLFGPGPGGAVAPVILFGPGPGGAMAPVFLFGPGPGGAMAPVFLLGPGPGGAMAPVLVFEEKVIIFNKNKRKFYFLRRKSFFGSVNDHQRVRHKIFYY